VNGFDRRFYAEMPAERLGVLRLFVGAFATVYLAARFTSFTSLSRFSAHEFSPVGPLFWMPAPLPAAALFALTVVTLLLAVAFTLGLRFRITGPAFALAFLLLTTYRSSFGMKFHTENLVCLHTLVLGFSAAADAVSLDARSRPRPSAHGRYGWAVRTLGLLTVVTYVLAGVAKLRLGGDAWFSGEVLEAQIAYDNLRKIELGSVHSPIGVALLSLPTLFLVLAWLTLLVELGAPVALLGGRWALLWSVLSWGFHASVLLLMMIAFAYPLSTVPYLAFFRAERWLETRPFRWMIRRLEQPIDSLARRAATGD
jgi:hypothetical protein